MARRHLLLFVDFDETLTRFGADTISRLASAAYARQCSSVQLPPWSYFADTYMRDYNRHTQSYPPETRNSLEAEKEFLKSLKLVERASIERVEASGLFKGLDFPAFLRTAVGDRQQLAEGLMRKGWWAATKKVLQRGESSGQVSVISVNWSRRWIRECLECSVQAAEGEMAEVRRIEIYANELVVEGNERTTTGALDRWFGDEDGGIWTGWDKLRVMKDIIHNNEKAFKEGKAQGKLVVYVGDSTTDLLCLLEADVGIIFGQKLDGVCERLGVEIQDGLGVENTGGTVGSRKILSRIEDWKEIEDWADTV